MNNNHITNKKTHKTRNDLILLAALLAIAATVFAAVGLAKVDGASVAVIVDGKTVASYPLGADREVSLEYNGHNTLSIKGGTAHVTDADCPDKLCVKQRGISKEGETIVCLPHKTVIMVKGGERPEVDSAL
ncbi:MAG: NusG domain II-containing protein [Clostridiales Family XIII bacterium]|jgi:hypothetical protein|nr:NusG domain II-containing protein [Clostridiales Family XIII bacterium]